MAAGRGTLAGNPLQRVFQPPLDVDPRAFDIRSAAARAASETEGPRQLGAQLFDFLARRFASQPVALTAPSGSSANVAGMGSTSIVGVTT